MPSFGDPFAGNVNRKLTPAELAQAIRLDIAGELEAIFLYDAHVQATDNVLAKTVLSDIRDEEKAHIGELMTLMRHLDPEETAHFVSGETEVKEMLEKLGIPVGPASPEDSELSSGPAATVGSLLDKE